MEAYLTISTEFINYPKILFKFDAAKGQARYLTPSS